MKSKITLWHLSKTFSVSILLSFAILSCQNNLFSLEAGGKGGNANKDKSVNEKLPPIQHDAECPKGCSKDKCKHPRLPAPVTQNNSYQPQSNPYNPTVEGNSDNNLSNNPPISNSGGAFWSSGPGYSYPNEKKEKESKEPVSTNTLTEEEIRLAEIKSEEERWEKIESEIVKKYNDKYQAIANELNTKVNTLIEDIKKSSEQERQRQEIERQNLNEYIKSVDARIDELKKLPKSNSKDIFIWKLSAPHINEIQEDLEGSEDVRSLPCFISSCGIKKGENLDANSKKLAKDIAKRIISNQIDLKHQYKILKLPLDKNPNHGDIPAQIAKAKELLDRLKSYKTQLFSILADHNESFQDYGFDENDYDSDPDNDYTRTELNEFLNNYDIGPCTQKFQDIKEEISNQSKDIIQLLGAKEDSSAYDFAGILSAKELVMQIQKRIQNHDKIEDICDDIVRAIVQNLPNPQVKAFNTTNLSKIKTQFDKLRLRISFVLQDAIEAMRQENAAQDMLSKNQNEDKKPQKKELYAENKQSNNIINTDKPTIEESKSNHGNNTESKSESEEDKPKNTDKFYDDLYGIDVSHYQKKIDWDKVFGYEWNKRKLEAVILKATEEIVPKKDKKDKWFKTNWQAVRNAGLKIKGAYHFFHAEGDSCPIKQANRFISLLKSPEIGFDLKNDFYVIDVESIYVKSKTDPNIEVEVTNYPSKEVFADKILKFYELMKKKEFEKGMIYTRTEFWNLRIGEFGRKIWDKGIPLWLARYGNSKGNIPDDKYYPTELPIGSDFPVMWQFTKKGIVGGINGDVDLNLIKIEFGK